MSQSVREPVGELAIRMLAMPANTNPNGQIFGGWVVSNMDLAGLSVAQQYTSYRVVTVAIDSMTFISPIYVGDFICCYASLVRLGNTSMTIKIETWAIGSEDLKRRLVTEGEFVYVSIDENGKPKALDKRADS